MADNVSVTDGAYTASVAADDIGGVHYQRVKVVLGADGAADTDLDSGQQTMANSVPVAIASNQSAITVEQATAANMNVTEASAASALTALQLIDNPVAVLGTATYTEAATSGYIIGAVRRDADTTLVNTTNEIAPLQVDANGYLKVEVFDGGGSHTVDNAGTFAVQVDGSALTSLQLIDDAIYADDADWTGDTSKHMLVGGLYESSQQTVTDGDVAPIALDTNGNVRTRIMHLPGPSYVASAAQTQTNLDGLAASATWVAGWESNAIDNSSNRYKDFRINAVLRTEGAAVTAGECRMYLVAEMEDSTWPDVFDGTESAETITDTEQRDAICRLAAVSANDTGTAENVYLMCPSARAVFLGTLPRKFVIFITQATGTTLETTGDPNQVYVAGVE